MQPDRPQDRALVEREQQDLVLAPEAGERRHAGDREPADDERAAVIGISLRSAPMQRMSCSSCMPWMTDPEPRNSSALKNAWVIMWKIAATYALRPDGEEHVAELADRRVGEHLLDVVLGDGDGGREQRGGDADDGDQGR